LDADYGDGPKHETSEIPDKKSETKVTQNNPPHHKNPVAATAVLNGFIIYKITKITQTCKPLPDGLMSNWFFNHFAVLATHRYKTQSPGILLFLVCHCFGGCPIISGVGSFG